MITTKKDLFSPDTVAYPPTLSFAGAGWLGMYYYGVGKVMQETGFLYDQERDEELLRNRSSSSSIDGGAKDDDLRISSLKASQRKLKFRLSGCSAGSIVSGGLACGLDMDLFRDYSLEKAEHTRKKWQRAFQLRSVLNDGVEKFIGGKLEQDPALLKVVNDNFEAYATVLPGFQTKIFGGTSPGASLIEDIEDVKEAIFASCCITPLAGMPFRCRKPPHELVLDGGIVVFQPRWQEPNVITVNALYHFHTHIMPSKMIPTAWCFYPPAAEEFRDVYNLGYNDGLDFLKNSGMIPDDDYSSSNSWRRREKDRRCGKDDGDDDGHSRRSIAHLKYLPLTSGALDKTGMVYKLCRRVMNRKF